MSAGPPGWRTIAPMSAVLQVETLDRLLEALRGRGFRPIGPTVRQGAITYDEIDSVADLPAGLTDVQDGGHYRLVPRGDGALFGYNVGPNSWKSHLFPATLTLWKARRSGRRRAPGRGGAGRAASLRLHRRALLRHARHRGAGPDLHGGRVGRPRLPGAPRGRLHRRGQLRQGRRHLLLRVDGHGSRARPAASTWPSPSCWTTAGTGSSWRWGASAGRRCWPSFLTTGAAPADEAAADAVARVHRRTDGAHARRHGHQGPPLPQQRASALGRGGRSLPHLRQLHAWSARPASAPAWTT